jgi:WD40 repeat protein
MPSQFLRCKYGFRAEAITFSPNGRYLAAAGMGGDEPPNNRRASVKVWDLKTGIDVGTVYTSSRRSVTFTGDSRQVLVNGRNILKYDLVTKKASYLPQNAGRLLISPDGRWPVRIWDAVLLLHEFRNGKIGRLVFRKSRPGGDRWAFSPDSKRLAVRGASGTLMLEVRTGKLLWWNKSSMGGSVAFSPDGKTLVTDNNRAEIVRISKGKRVLTGWTDPISLWDAANGKRKMDLKCNAGVRAVDFSPDGKLVAGLIDGGGGDGQQVLAAIWETKTGALGRGIPVWSVPGKGDQPRDLKFSPDGRMMAVALQGVIGLWRIR